jgi:hypothetical protein
MKKLLIQIKPPKILRWSKVGPANAQIVVVL